MPPVLPAGSTSGTLNRAGFPASGNSGAVQFVMLVMSEKKVKRQESGPCHRVIS